VKPQWDYMLRISTMTWNGPSEPIDTGTPVIHGVNAADEHVADFRAYDWPHMHPCARCGKLYLCECPFAAIDHIHVDEFAICEACKQKRA
jgi:hypothetical protein